MSQSSSEYFVNWARRHLDVNFPSSNFWNLLEIIFVTIYVQIKWSLSSQYLYSLDQDIYLYPLDQDIYFYPLDKDIYFYPLDQDAIIFKDETGKVHNLEFIPSYNFMQMPNSLQQLRFPPNPMSPIYLFREKKKENRFYNLLWIDDPVNL